MKIFLLRRREVFNQPDTRSLAVSGFKMDFVHEHFHHENAAAIASRRDEKVLSFLPVALFGIKAEASIFHQRCQFLLIDLYLKAKRFAFVIVMAVFNGIDTGLLDCHGNVHQRHFVQTRFAAEVKSKIPNHLQIFRMARCGQLVNFCRFGKKLFCVGATSGHIQQKCCR